MFGIHAYRVERVLGSDSGERGESDKSASCFAGAVQWCGECALLPLSGIEFGDYIQKMHTTDRLFSFSLFFFYGTQHAIERAHAAWKAGQITKTGVMIHDVIAEVDMGEPLLVREIPFVEGEDDDVEKFEEKVHSTEWKIVPEGVALAVKQVQENKRN